MMRQGHQTVHDRISLARVLACALVLFCAAGPAEAQEGSRSAQMRIDNVDATSPPKIKISFTELKKDGSAADRRAPAKYRLRVDGLAGAPAASLQNRAEAKGMLNLVLLVQISPTMTPAMPEITAGGARPLASLDARTMAGLVAFTDVVHKTVPLGSPKKIAAEIKRLTIQSAALTVQVPDAVHEGLDMLKKADEGQQKMLVLIGNGLTKDLNQKTFSDLGRACAEQKVVCHTIGFNPLEPDRMRTLYELSQRGRGTYRPAASLEELKKSLMQLQGELEGQLTVTYELPPPAAGETFHPFDGKEHDFELSITGTRLSDIIVAKTSVAGGEGKAAATEEEEAATEEAGFWASYWWILPVGFGVLLLLVVPLIIYKRVTNKKPARKDEMPQARRRTAYLDPDGEDEDDEVDEQVDGDLTGVRPANTFIADSNTSPPMDSPSWVGGTGVPPPTDMPSSPGSAQSMSQPAATGPDMSLPSARPPQAQQPAPLSPQVTPPGQAPLSPQQSTQPGQNPMMGGAPVGGGTERQTSIPSQDPAFPPAAAPQAAAPQQPAPGGPQPLFNLPSPAEFMANQSQPGGLQSHPVPSPAPAHIAAPAPISAPPMAAPMPQPSAPVAPAAEFPVFDVPSNASFNTAPAAAANRIQLQPGSNLEILPTDKPEMAVGLGGGAGGFVDRHTQILDMGQVSKDDLNAWIVPLDDPSYPTVRVRDGFMLGADASCDFIVQGQGVEGRHAVLDLALEGYKLRWAAAETSDDAQLLLDNDRFRVGDREFLFKLARPFAEEPRARARLEVLDGLDKGRSLALMDSVPYAVGSHPSCALVLRGKGVGSRHAIALRKQSVCFMEDLGAESGLLYNGGPVGSKGIKPGEEITLGGVRILFALD